MRSRSNKTPTSSCVETLVRGNTAARSGGAIEDGGNLLITKSTVADNTVSGNGAYGGGLAVDNLSQSKSATLGIANSTFTGNVVEGTGADGAAIFSTVLLTIDNSTVVGNTASAGGGAVATSEGETALANDVIASNAGGNCEGTGTASEGGNVFGEDTTCETRATGEPKGDVFKGPGVEESEGKPKLAENGGPTPTLALLSSSPARESGLQKNCPSEDQRGEARPGGANCSSGAYQYGTQNTTVLIEGKVSLLGAGTVTATSTVAGAECTSNACHVPKGGSGEVVLKAEAKVGYQFKDWENCAEELGDECYIENTSEAHVATAVFVPISRITISGRLEPSGEGTVIAKSSSAGAECSEGHCSVYPGSKVELSVASANGYGLAGWSGGRCKANENPCVIEDVSAGETDTATMAARVTITGKVAASENTVGDIKMTTNSPDPSCAYEEEHVKNFEGFESSIIINTHCTVDAGSNVTLEYVNYTAQLHFYVAAWSGGSCKGYENPCEIEDVKTSETDTAALSWTPHESNLAVQGSIAAGTGTITATSPTSGAACSASTCKVPPGGSVSLAVTPVAGGTFLGWSGGSCKGTENPCVVENVQKAETDTATVRPPITVSSISASGQGVQTVVQGSEYGSDEYYNAQNGTTVDLNAVIDDNGVAGTYEVTYVAQFGGCGGSYSDKGTLGPFTLPASAGNQDITLPWPLTGASAFPSGAKIAYTVTATRGDGYKAKAAGYPLLVGSIAISAANYNPHGTAEESGAVIDKTAKTATLSANVYFDDQAAEYEQVLHEAATAVTPAVVGNSGELAAEEYYEHVTPPAYAVWLGYSPAADGGGLAFLGGANESFPTPEYGIFELGTSTTYADPGYVIGPDDVLGQCYVHPGLSTEEQEQTVRDVATGLQPDTVYHYRLVQAFAEGVCPFRHDEGLEDCLDTHSGTPKYVPYVGGFTAAEGFGGSSSGYAKAWNPRYGPGERIHHGGDGRTRAADRRHLDRRRSDDDHVSGEQGVLLRFLQPLRGRADLDQESAPGQDGQAGARPARDRQLQDPCPQAGTRRLPPVQRR